MSSNLVDFVICSFSGVRAGDDTKGSCDSVPLLYASLKKSVAAFGEESLPRRSLLLGRLDSTNSETHQVHFVDYIALPARLLSQRYVVSKLDGKRFGKKDNTEKLP